MFTAGNGWDALDAFSQYRPALTITDLRMPSLDEFQVRARIRDISDAHVLVLTALGSEEHLVRELELGADEYLVKPVSKGGFLARVGSLLSLRDKVEQNARNPTLIRTFPRVGYRYCPPDRPSPLAPLGGTPEA